MSESDWSDYEDLDQSENTLNYDNCYESQLKQPIKLKSEFLMEIENFESDIRDIESQQMEENINDKDRMMVEEEQQLLDYNLRQVAYTLQANVLPSEIVIEIVSSYLLNGRYWGQNLEEKSSYGDLLTIRSNDQPLDEYNFLKNAFFNRKNHLLDWWYTNPYQTVAWNHLTYCQKQFHLVFNTWGRYVPVTDPDRIRETEHLKKIALTWTQEQSETMIMKAIKLKLV